MIKDTLVDAIILIWPMIVIFTIIISSIRIAYLVKNKKNIVLYKELYYLFFLIYILLLFYFVTFQDNNFGTHNFSLFKEITRYKVFSKMFFKNIIGNILLFMPFGFFVSAILKSKSFFSTFVLGFISSFSIELVQYLIGRTFDVDDILLNVIGVVFGYFVFVVLNRIKNKLPKIFKSQFFLSFLMILIVIVVVLYLTNWYTYIFRWFKL